MQLSIITQLLKRCIFQDFYALDKVAKIYIKKSGMLLINRGFFMSNRE